MKALTLKGKDGREFRASIFDEVDNPICVMQYAHGMAEYSQRYAEEAAFFNAHGIIMAGSDHRGQGYTATELGVTEGDSYHDTVEDMSVLNEYLRTTYSLPIIFFGHSYGSFLGQRFIQLYGDKLAGVIFTGSNCMNKPLLLFGGTVCSIKKLFGKGKEKDEWMVGMTFGKYDTYFPEGERPFAWISSDREQVGIFKDDPMSGYTMCTNFYASFLFGVHATYRKKELNKIPKDLPICLLSGKEDPVGDLGEGVLRLAEVYRSLGLDVECKLYDGVRHKILSEVNREEVKQDMLSFIKKILKK